MRLADARDPAAQRGRTTQPRTVRSAALRRHHLRHDARRPTSDEEGGRISMPEKVKESAAPAALVRRVAGPGGHT